MIKFAQKDCEYTWLCYAATVDFHRQLHWMQAAVVATTASKARYHYQASIFFSSSHCQPLVQSANGRLAFVVCASVNYQLGIITDVVVVSIGCVFTVLLGWLFLQHFVACIAVTSALARYKFQPEARDPSQQIVCRLLDKNTRVLLIAAMPMPCNFIAAVQKASQMRPARHDEPFKFYRRRSLTIRSRKDH